MRSSCIRSAVVAVVVLFGAPLHAMTLDVGSIDNGRYSNAGVAGATASIVAGRNNAVSVRNWFAFDLSGIDTGGIVGKVSVTSATLSIAAANGTWTAEDLVYSVFDFKSDINALISRSTNAAIYDDLGSGRSYGQSVHLQNGNRLDPMSAVSVVLSSFALKDLDKAIRTNTVFALGGAVSSPDAGSSSYRLWFGSSGAKGGEEGFNPAGTLSLTYEVLPAVPLPAGLPLLLAGLGCLAALRRLRAV